MRRNKVLVFFVLAIFTITSLYTYKTIPSSSSIQRPIILTVDISEFDASTGFPYSLGLGMIGSSDAITVRDSTYEFKGWVDPAVDKIGLVTTKTPHIGIHQVNVMTTARPDAAVFFKNPRLEFSGYSFSLNKKEFGEVVCIYISKGDQARLLYINEKFRTLIPSP